jgi:dihydroorotate dehydrogenase
MFSKFRSLIFKIDPETAHNLAIKSLKLNLLPNFFDENKETQCFKLLYLEKK